MRYTFYIKAFSTVVAGLALISCGAGGEDQGLEYAPNMYHSRAYEPLKQVTDPEAGTLAETLDRNHDGHGEYYSSNPLNPNHMNMRVPPEHTVRRTEDGFLPYRIPKDSIDLASRILKDPLPASEEVLQDGAELYGRFCDHCHGGAGTGADPGSVGEVFAGVPAYNSVAVRDLSEGHIFHVITYGKGRMGAHGSQISIEDRWKLVRYIQTLQKK